MNSCVAASEAVAPAKPAWRAVYSLGLGVFGLITAEFLPASLLTPMAASLGVSEGMAGQAVTATALVVSYFSGPLLNFGDFSRYGKSMSEIRRGNRWGLPFNFLLFSVVTVVIVSGTDRKSVV